jgi:hypothetical protein
MVCALNSVCTGVLLYMRFNAIKAMDDMAFHWVKESRKTRHSVLWNMPALVALPTVWLGWYVHVRLVFPIGAN